MKFNQTELLTNPEVKIGIKEIMEQYGSAKGFIRLSSSFVGDVVEIWFSPEKATLQDVVMQEDSGYDVDSMKTNYTYHTVAVDFEVEVGIGEIIKKRK